MDNKYKRGDIVQLINGGPSMVVHSLDSEGFLHCKWHDKDGKPCCDYYFAEMLKPG